MKYVNPASFGRLQPEKWQEVPDIYTQCFWPEKLPHKPADYGSNGFHGRTHPDVIFCALERYTEPGDLVWDCFAGSGTTIDVCKELDNPCIANDINPTRPDIIQADSRLWKPDTEVELVVCHPPYMGIIYWQGEGSLATNDVHEFLDGMALVFDNITEALRSWHVLVLICGQVYVGGQTYMLDHLLYNLLMTRYRCLGRVVREYGETKGGATSGNKNENLWKYRRLKYGIWALGIDTVLWLQKVV